MFVPPFSTSQSFRSFFRFAGLLLIPVLLGGCGGGDAYSVNEGKLAQYYLPSERTLSHHPDSLKALTITEKENKIQYQLEQDYESLTEKWSCGYPQDAYGRDYTYATFWSLELSLASLQPEMGILTLRKERARELLEKRQKEYFQTIQIDVYHFVQEGRRGVLAGPGTHVRLHVRDDTYRPVRSDYGPLREAFLSGGSTALYRRNTFFFSRTVDGEDILADATEMHLDIGMGGSADQFTWKWGERSKKQRALAKDPS